MTKLGRWVKLYDSFWDSSVAAFGDNEKLLALWLISHARRTDGYYKGVKVLRGSTAYSERELAEDLGWSYQTMRTARRNLEGIGFLIHTATHHFTIATIRHYDKYQSNPTHHSTHTQRTPNATSPVTIRRKKEDNIIGTSKKKKVNRKLGYNAFEDPKYSHYERDHVSKEEAKKGLAEAKRIYRDRIKPKPKPST